MNAIALELVGLSPLLMHSERGANPLDPQTKAMKALTSKKKKTDEDYELMAEMDWRQGIYYDEAIGPYLPGLNIRAAIVAGGKMNKIGTALQKGTMILDEKVPLRYEGPRDMDKLWADSRFRDVRSVVVSKNRLMRCRPIFHDWAVGIEIVYDRQIIDMEQILLAANNAGSYIGLGDFRPGKGNGAFGRFEVRQKAVD